MCVGKLPVTCLCRFIVKLKCFEQALWRVLLSLLSRCTVFFLVGYRVSYFGKKTKRTTSWSRPRLAKTISSKIHLVFSDFHFFSNIHWSGKNRKRWFHRRLQTNRWRIEEEEQQWGSNRVSKLLISNSFTAVYIWYVHFRISIEQRDYC